MDKRVGWIVAVVAIVVAAVLGAWGSSRARELARLEGALAASEAQLAQIERELDAAHARAEKMGEQLEVTRAEFAAIEKQVTAQALQAAGEVPPEPEAAEEEPPAEDSEAGPAPEDRQERIMQAQMKLMVNMAYATFFEEQNLPPEVQEEMAELLAASGAKTQMATIAAIRAGDRIAKDIKSEQDVSDAALRAQLAEVLNAEELAAYDEYAEYEDIYLFEALLDGQLRMLAPGLGEENTATVKTVFAEELGASINAFNESDQFYTLTNFNAAQAEGLRAGLERLTEELDEDQYAHAESFVTQAEAMFEAAAE